MFLSFNLPSLITTLIFVGLMIAFLLIEFGTTELVSIWFAGGALAAAIVSIFTDKLYILIPVFVVVSAILLIFCRKLILKGNKEALQTNASGLVGQEAKIIDITADDIRVLHGDTTWYTIFNKDDKFEVNEKVVVADVVGNKLKIEKKEEK